MRNNFKRLAALLLLIAMLIPLNGMEAYGYTGLTSYIDEIYGNEVSMSGEAMPEAEVTLKAVRKSDSNVRHTSQVRADSQGKYSFLFNLPKGEYRLIVSSIGLTVEKSLSVRDVDSGKATVRVEGIKSTILSEYKLDVVTGYTTLWMAVKQALDDNDIPYEENGEHGFGGIGPENEGNNADGGEGWQWMVNGKGGQLLPGDYVNEGDSIVLVPGGLWNPTLTKLSVSPDTEVVTESTLTARLEQYNTDIYGDIQVSAVEGQAVRFGSESKTTDEKGQADFVPASTGVFPLSCEPGVNEAGNPLIRPVPLSITVKDSTGPGPGENTVRLSVDAKTIGKGTLLTENVEYTNGDTAYSVLERAIGAENLRTTNSSMGVYVASMRFSSTGWLGEFDNGQGSGWMVNVNGKYINVSAGRYRVQAGDEVNWRYTTNYGKDLGAEVADAPSSSSAAGASSIADVKNKTLREMLEKATAGGLTDKEIAELAKAAVTEVMDKTNLNTVSADKAKELAGDLRIVADTLTGTVKDVSSIQDVLIGIIETTKELSGKMEQSDGQAAREAVLEAAEKAMAKNSTVEIKGTTIKVTASDMQAVDSFNQAIIASLKGSGIAPAKGRSPQSEITFQFEGGKVVIPASSLTDKDRSISLRTDGGVTDIKAEPATGSIMKVYLPTAVTGNQATVIMTGADGSETNVGGVYDEATGMMVFTATGSGKYRIEENKVTFTDLGSYQWAREYIEAMAAKGIVSGKADGIFDPSGKVKRAEFAAMLVRAMKAAGSGSAGFSDVKADDWFAGSVAAAVQNSLMQGKGDGLFDPNGSITRQELAVAMANVLKSLGYAGSGTTDSFRDKDDIAAWAEDGVALAAEYGLILGDSQGNFNPTAEATRAEAAVMMARLYELIMK